MYLLVLKPRVSVLTSVWRIWVQRRSHKLSRLQSVEMIFLWFRKVHFQLDPKIYFSSNQGQPRKGFFPPHDSYHVRRTPFVAIDTSAEFSAERNESSADDGI